MARNSRFRTTSATTSKKSFSDKGKKKRFDKRSSGPGDISKAEGEKFSKPKSSSRPFPDKGPRFQKPAFRDKAKGYPEKNDTTSLPERSEGYPDRKPPFKKPRQGESRVSGQSGGGKRFDKKGGSYLKKPIKFQKRTAGPETEYKPKERKSFDDRRPSTPSEGEVSFPASGDLIWAISSGPRSRTSSKRSATARSWS